MELIKNDIELMHVVKRLLSFVFCSLFLSLACPPGMYKDIIGNGGSCFVCPKNSNSTSPGSATCTCMKGYYRTSVETANEPCTSQYSRKIYTIYVQVFFHISCL